MTKRLSATEKIGRKPASRACVFCHSKHLQCSNERPCRNCVKRNIGHECHDIVRKKAKYMKVNSGSKSQSAMSSSMEPESNDGPGSNLPALHQQHLHLHKLQHLQQLLPEIKQERSNFKNNRMLNTTNDVLNRISTNTSQYLDFSRVTEQQQSVNNPNLDMFNSNYLNQEYLMLGDILLHSKPTSPLPSASSEAQLQLQQQHSLPQNQLQSYDPVLDNVDILQRLSSQQQQPPAVVSRKKNKIDTRPFISLGFSKLYSDHELDLNVNNITYNSFNTRESTENSSNTEGILDNRADSKFIVHNQIMQNKETSAFNKSLKTSSTNLPYEYMSPMETHNLYQRVQDIYAKNIVDFEYPQSYHLLTYFLKKRFLGNTLSLEGKQRKRANLLIILKLIASYRPTFISAHKSLLKPYDFQFLEMSFQRSLIDCEKLAQLNLSPTIIWRRTGEIVSLSDDLLSLLGFSVRDILSKRTFIMELMYDDELIVNYFKLFKSVAVGNLHSSIITKCKLIRKVDEENGSDKHSQSSHILNHDPYNEDLSTESNEYIEFCSVWTVKRDLFDIPMLIVGQFLPIFTQGEGVRMY